MRVIPRMHVIYPCDAIQAQKATQAIAQTPAPTYLRLAKQKTPIMTSDETAFEIGKAQTLFESQNHELSLGVVSAGPVLHAVLDAARDLDARGTGVRILNMHTIKPLDTDALDELARDCEKILTVEEHQRAGGLGSAVAEHIVQSGQIRPMYIHGIDNRFGESGTADELLAKHKLDKKGIVECADKLLGR